MRSEAPPVSESSRINVHKNERLLSTVGGGLMVLGGLRRFSLPGLVTAAAGGILLYRGLTGHCPGYETLGIDTAANRGAAPDVEIEEALTVYKPREDVYQLWRELENLPRFMRHLESVEHLDGRRTRWTARVPKGIGSITWEAETTEDRPNEKISWRSLPGSTIHNAGTVSFRDGPDGSTEVVVNLRYRPPAGDVGTAAAELLNPVNAQMIREDVRRFKHLLEAGEIPQTEGQPVGPNSH